MKPSSDITRPLFTSGPWTETLSQSFGFTIRPLPIPGGATTIPFAELDDLLGARLAGLPFTDYLEVADSVVEIERALNSYVAANPTQMIQGKFLPAAADDRVPTGFTHRLRVDSPEVLLAAASQNFRWGVNRAARDGVVVTHTRGKKALHRFHNLLVSQRRQKFGILTHPMAFFGSLAANLESAGEMFFVESQVGENLASSALIVGYGNCLYYKFNASDANFLKHQVNNAVLASVFEYAHENGYEWVDLGLSWNSEDNAGLIGFKDSTGASRRNVYRIEATGPDFSAKRLEEGRDLMRNLTAYLTTLDLPDEDLEGASDLLFRYFI